MDFKLKSIPPSLLPVFRPDISSDTLHASPVPAHDDIRDFYLSNQSLVPPPLISCSTFIPRKMVSHLMRRKKRSALGVKFVPRSRGRLDEITNMEGALHTFVTPVIGRCEMVGDYRFQGGHGIVEFGDVEGDDGRKLKLTRTVVLSAGIQPDFEDSQVMLHLCRLEEEEVSGQDLLGLEKNGEGWEIPSAEEKQDERKRGAYDDALRRHLIFHLTASHVLPSLGSVQESAMDIQTTISFLESLILSPPADLPSRLLHRFSKTPHHATLSLELLFNTALQQTRNEFSALEALCPNGYIYTHDPPSIFASSLSAPLLSRLFLLALAHLAAQTPSFPNLRVFAFNDYADRAVITLAATALQRIPHVHVRQKAALFAGVAGRYHPGDLSDARGAMLVIHNNSDGFGQNVETEGRCGSLDGAVGASSSGAGSLHRGREDLLDFVF